MPTVELYTDAGRTLAAQPWQAYPRPQLRRDSFLNLNGEWEYASGTDEQLPQIYDKKIRVPFAPESLLSGVPHTEKQASYHFYRTQFSLSDGFVRARVLLHFGAVDQSAAVWLNGVQIGTHVGGYTHFSFDITAQLQRENTLVVRAYDPLCKTLPYGKQTDRRGGMWYTPVSGIWQTVWLESVPERYIRALEIRTDAAGAVITTPGQTPDGTVRVTTPQGELCVPLTGGCATVRPDAPHLWSPETPYLYRFTLEAGEDTVESYFALRTLECRQVNGVPRLCLNGKPYFFHGLLDQGYWPDGLFTPATPACYEKDIAAMKRLGFNTLRKHIKVEPEQFYYDCDRLGMIVFQDMVNNGGFSAFYNGALPTAGLQRLPDRYTNRGEAQRTAFLQAMDETLAQLKNHPCICYWTIFNEGWGQFESTAAYERLRAQDDSRPIDSTSGWFRCGKTDVESRHVYFRKFRLPKSDKPVVLSEFGGYSFKPEGHVFNPEHTYAYRFFTQRGEYESALLALYRNEILPAIPNGLCAAIYTQVSDVEDETNGLLSYDRAVCKVDGDAMRALAEQLCAAIENDGKTR